MKRFLLVDDDEHEYIFVNFLLKDRYKNNYKLGYVSNIRDAQSYLACEGVDTILLDDKLGNGLTSVDSIPLLKKKAFNVPIVIISKDVDGKHLQDRIRFGVNKVIDKFKLKNELARGILD